MFLLFMLNIFREELKAWKFIESYFWRGLFPWKNWNPDNEEFYFKSHVFFLFRQKRISSSEAKKCQNIWIHLPSNVAILIDWNLVYSTVGTVLSAPREEIIAQSPVLGELHETRESEVTRNEESLHRLASVAKEPLPVANQSQTEEPTTLSPTALQHEKVQFNDSESKDMLATRVTPQDDDDLTSEKATKSNHVRATTIFAPIEFPKNSTDVEIRMATPEWIQYLNIDKNNATNSNATKSDATNSSATNSNATNPKTKKKKGLSFISTAVTFNGKKKNQFKSQSFKLKFLPDRLINISLKIVP